MMSMSVALTGRMNRKICSLSSLLFFLCKEKHLNSLVRKSLPLRIIEFIVNYTFVQYKFKLGNEHCKIRAILVYYAVQYLSFRAMREIPFNWGFSECVFVQSEFNTWRTTWVRPSDLISLLFLKKKVVDWTKTSSETK